jgi:hypothetical protein
VRSAAARLMVMSGLPASDGRGTRARPASHVWNASVDVPRRTRRNAYPIKGAAPELNHRTSRRGSRGSASLRAPESAHQQWGGSPHRTEHWLSVVEGNCVVERRGGKQPETNCQSINKTMLNTIRPDALASLRRVSEAQNRTPTREGQGNFGDLLQRRDSERGRRNAWGGW